MRTMRGVVLLAGVGIGLWGAWKLAAYGLSDLTPVVLWLAGGVFSHDALVVPLTLVLALGARLLPRPWRAPAAVGLVVLGSVTLLAIPVLGRFGAHDDNPTLLDRNYLLGWGVLAALTMVAVAVAGWRRRAAGLGDPSVSSKPLGDERTLPRVDPAAPRSTGPVAHQ